MDHQERGDTLIELLISIVVLSIGVLGIYSAIGSSIAAADRLKARADASQLVARAADVIQNADWACSATPADNFADALTALKPTPAWVLEVTSMSHWGPSRTFEDGCPNLGDDAAFKTLKMWVLVQSPNGRGSQTVELLKRP